jgi:hypothetical protein
MLGEISWSRSVKNGVELRAECPHLFQAAPRSAGGCADNLLRTLFVPKIPSEQLMPRVGTRE